MVLVGTLVTVDPPKTVKLDKSGPNMGVADTADANAMDNVSAPSVRANAERSADDLQREVSIVGSRSFGVRRLWGR